MQESLSQRQADLEYLRILHLAASTMESDVAAALELLLGESTVPRYERVRSLLDRSKPEVPAVETPPVNLSDYDHLLSQIEEVAS